MTTSVKERPILFSGPMVAALLAGRKSQTRRALNPQPTLIDAKGGGKIWHLKTRTGFANSNADGSWPAWMVRHAKDQDGNVYPAVCPYGAAGDRLWVREAFHVTAACDAVYRADYPANAVARGMENIPAESDVRWTPSIHMPRWASRLTLEVTEVRVQRLQDISEEDARAEGVAGPFDALFTPRRRFESLWDSINGERPGCSWEANCWVWAVSFRVLEVRP